MGSGLVRYKNSPYFVSEEGNIFSEVSGDLVELKGYIQKNGYKVVKLRNTDESKSVYRWHRVVAECLIPNTEAKPQVNHIDGNKLNNHPSNLEWCTSKENIAHAIDKDIFGKTTNEDAVKRGIKRGKLTAFFTVDEASELIEMQSVLNLTFKELASVVGCARSTVTRLIRGEIKAFREAV